LNVCTDDLLASVELDGRADPVILSADIAQFCNDSGSTFVIKPYEATSIA